MWLLLAGCVTMPSEVPDEPGTIDAALAPELASAASPDLPYLVYLAVLTVQAQDYRSCPAYDATANGFALTGELLKTLRGSGAMTTARQMVSELMAIDEEARIFSEVHPACKTLTLLARFERENLEGGDPLALAETTLRIYEGCRARASLTADKLHRILALL